MNKLSIQQKSYLVIALSGVVGLIASFLQTLAKLEILSNPQAVLSCNINAVFSCSNILNVWQSSVFGFPNSLMCIVFFTILITAGLIGLGSSINAKARLVIQGLALFFAGFGFWYLWQSIFVIGALCIYCLFCYAPVLVTNGVLFRLNQKELSYNKQAKRIVDYLIKNSYDTLIWVLIAVVIAGEILIKFAAA